MFAPAQAGGSSAMIASVAVGAGMDVGVEVGIGVAAGAQPVRKMTSAIPTSSRSRISALLEEVSPYISHLSPPRTLLEWGLSRLQFFLELCKRPIHRGTTDEGIDKETKQERHHGIQ